MSTHNYDDLRKSEPPTQDPEYAAKNPSVPAPDNSGDNPISFLPSLVPTFLDILQAWMRRVEEATGIYSADTLQQFLDSPEYVRANSAETLKGNGGVPAFTDSLTGKVYSESELQSYMLLHGGGGPATVSPETQKESFEQFKYHTYRFSYWDELRFWIDEAKLTIQDWFDDLRSESADLWESVRQFIAAKEISKLENTISDSLTAAAQISVRCAQQYFLLEQAPMLDMVFDRDRLAKQVVAYGYVNPATWAKFCNQYRMAVPTTSSTKLGTSPTTWILTNLMPINRMIMSPNLMPGFPVPEKKSL